MSLVVVSICIKADIFPPVTQVTAQVNEPIDPCVLGSPKNDKWARINEYDSYFAQAAEEFDVDGNLLKAMAMVESGGQGHYEANGSVIVRGCDSYNCQPAVGMMQVKPAIWQSLVPDADPYDPLGNVRLGAAIMATAIKEHGSWQEALTKVYFPGDDANGTTQNEYVEIVENYLVELGGGDCADTSTPNNPRTPSTSNSNSGQSTCVVTKVGNPSVSPVLPASCQKTSGSTNSSDFVQTAEDIMDAYAVCGEPKETTFVYSGLSQCLEGELTKDNYSTEQIEAFKSRLTSSVAGGCTQCLGYVGLVTALSTGISDGSKTLAATGMDTAGNLNVAPFGPNGFPVGDAMYMQIGSGPSAEIQSGDIAVAGTPYEGDHIGIVYNTVEGDDAHFQIIESNGGYDCRVSKDRGPIAKDGYTFYRKE